MQIAISLPDQLSIRTPVEVYEDPGKDGLFLLVRLPGGPLLLKRSSTNEWLKLAGSVYVSEGLLLICKKFAQMLTETLLGNCRPFAEMKV